MLIFYADMRKCARRHTLSRLPVNNYKVKVKNFAKK